VGLRPRTARVDVSPVTIDCILKEVPCAQTVLIRRSVTALGIVAHTVVEHDRITTSSMVHQELINNRRMPDCFCRYSDTLQLSLIGMLQRFGGAIGDDRHLAKHIGVRSKVVYHTPNPRLTVICLGTIPCRARLGPEIQYNHIVVWNSIQQGLYLFGLPKL